MDAKLFRVGTEPNYYKSLQAASPVPRNSVQTNLLPAPDNRFPSWAGPMSDARLVTDYSTHCSKNIPVGSQYPTTLWMQRNADGIIEYSRKKVAEITGAVYPFERNVVPPPSSVLTCKRSGCTRIPTNIPGGIGVERQETPEYELFGTYEDDRTHFAKELVAKTGLTLVYEGGRNSLRGVYGPPGL